MAMLETMSHYFFSGDIYMNPFSSKSVTPSVLTDTELLDIIESYDRKTLKVTTIEEIKAEYLSRGSGGSGSGSGASIDEVALRRDIMKNARELQELKDIEVPAFVSVFKNNLR